MNRYNQDARCVEPLPIGNAYVLTPTQVSHLMQVGSDGPTIPPPQTTSVIDNVFTPMSISRDPYSPSQRAWGLFVRSLPFAIVYVILAIGIAEHFALDVIWLYLLFGVPMLATVAYMSDRIDHYTPAGVEIERIAAAERTEFVKGERQERILDKHLTHQQELRRMALEATLRMLERGDSHEK